MRGRGGTPTGQSLASAGLQPAVPENPYGTNEASIVRNSEIDSGSRAGSGYAPYF